MKRIQTYLGLFIMVAGFVATTSWAADVQRTETVRLGAVTQRLLLLTQTGEVNSMAGDISSRFKFTRKISYIPPGYQLEVPNTLTSLRALVKGPQSYVDLTLPEAPKATSNGYFLLEIEIKGASAPETVANDVARLRTPMEAEGNYSEYKATDMIDPDGNVHIEKTDHDVDGETLLVEAKGGFTRNQQQYLLVFAKRYEDFAKLTYPSFVAQQISSTVGMPSASLLIGWWPTEKRSENPDVVEPVQLEVQAMNLLQLQENQGRNSKFVGYHMDEDSNIVLTSEKGDLELKLSLDK